VALEIVWSPLARARLREIRAYVARDKPDAAARLAIRIVALVEALKEHPYLGRMGSEPEVRELVVGGTPYLVFYRVSAKRVTITTIWHAIQIARLTQPAENHHLG
jgi:plasmid stabilization system protein ParE